MESMMFRVTDEFGHYFCDMQIPWGELYLIKQTFLCDVQPFQLILY
jgi:hypothetical protein